MLEKLKNQKKMWLPIVGGVIGVLLILFGGNLGGEKTKGSTDGEAYYNVSFYTETLERRIESLCTSISGISKAEVLLTLDCSTEYVYAHNTSQQSVGGDHVTFSTDFIILNHDGNDSGAVVMEIYPKIRGIAVVCTGGEEIGVKQKIIELLSAALGISSNRIKVAGG